MEKRNPYVISFGRIPVQYISRSLITDDIISTLNSEVVEEQAFKLTGVRGSGKTVTLTTISKSMKEDKNWIVVQLKSSGNVTADLIANLYTAIPFVAKYMDANLNLSAFGIGLNISQKRPVASLDEALKTILEEIQKKKSVS